MKKAQQIAIFKKYLDQICKETFAADSSMQAMFGRKMSKQTISDMYDIIMHTIDKLQTKRLKDILKGDLLDTAKLNVYGSLSKKNQKEPLPNSTFLQYATELGISPELVPPLVCQAVDYLITEVIEIFILLKAPKPAIPLTIANLKEYDKDIASWIDKVEA